MAAATGSYKRILQILEKWPVDKTKPNRDLGQYLRDTVNKAYKDNTFEAEQKFWDKQYLNLQRITSNTHKNKYPRVLVSSGTGLNKEECNLALSSEYLSELDKEDEGIVKKLMRKKTQKE